MNFDNHIYDGLLQVPAPMRAYTFIGILHEEKDVIDMVEMDANIIDDMVAFDSGYTYNRSDKYGELYDKLIYIADHMYDNVNEDADWCGAQISLCKSCIHDFMHDQTMAHICYICSHPHDGRYNCICNTCIQKWLYMGIIEPNQTGRR
jgi:hypothetical protein